MVLECMMAPATRSHGERERERRTRPERALDADRAAVRRHDRLRDGEAKSGPLRRRGCLVVGLEVSALWWLGRPLDLVRR
jgi:hypothetical protein